MNKAQIMPLMQDGAYFDVRSGRLHHPSFKNGSRKLSSISWNAVERELLRSGQLSYENGICRLLKQAA